MLQQTVWRIDGLMDGWTMGNVASEHLGLMRQSQSDWNLCNQCLRKVLS